MRALMVTIACVGIAVPAVADPPPAQLVGRLVDDHGRPLESATVSAGGTTTYTNAAGVYRLVLPRRGTYEVALSYADEQQTRTVAIDGPIATLDAKLPVDSETVIVIHDPRRIAVAPRPANPHAQRIVPPYSDAASEHDTWARAWLLLDVDATGHVARVKLLSKPGYDLEPIAVRAAFGLAFTPARDAAGRAMPSLVLWMYEWPAYWWLVQMEGVTTGMSAQMYGVPCRGAGPLEMSSMHRVYRDCSGPDPGLAATAHWISR